MLTAVRLRALAVVAVLTGLLAAALAVTGPASATAVASPPPWGHGNGWHPAPITMYVAGDSTASLWPADVAPKAGWGQALPVFLNDTFMRVEDRALSGASSKSFIDKGLLDGILADIKPGDYLLISFGHNDEKTTDPARGTDPATTFPEYLTQYIQGARRHGAFPILATPVERRRFTADGQARASHGAYPQAMLDLGAQLRVPVVDLTTLSRQLWQQLGPEGTKTCFLYQDPGVSPNWPDGVQDNTHFQAHGAIEVARLVVRDMARRHLLPPGVAQHLHDEVPDSALTWPVTI